jgi:hypothetical protein
MKNTPGIKKLFTLLISFLFIADSITAQQPTLPKDVNRPVRKSDITHFTLTTTFGDGFDSDDWNLDGYKETTGAGEIVYAERWAPAGSYLFRF